MPVCGGAMGACAAAAIHAHKTWYEDEEKDYSTDNLLRLLGTLEYNYCRMVDKLDQNKLYDRFKLKSDYIKDLEDFKKELFKLMNKNGLKL